MDPKELCFRFIVSFVCESKQGFSISALTKTQMCYLMYFFCFRTLMLLFNRCIDLSNQLIHDVIHMRSPFDVQIEFANETMLN